MERRKKIEEKEKNKLDENCVTSPGYGIYNRLEEGTQTKMRRNKQTGGRRGTGGEELSQKEKKYGNMGQMNYFLHIR